MQWMSWIDWFTAGFAFGAIFAIVVVLIYGEREQ